MTIEARLRELGITIPETPAPTGAFVPWTRLGELLIVSGQGTRVDGVFQHLGRLGDGITIADGKAAARICGLNILSRVKDACDGDLSRVVQVLRLTGYVASTPDFRDHPAVVSACSELMVEVFGEAGRHARTAMGVASLPNGMSVEIEALVRIREA